MLLVAQTTQNTIFETIDLFVSILGLAFVGYQLWQLNIQTRNQVSQLEVQVKQLTQDKQIVKTEKALDMALEFSNLIKRDLGYYSELYKDNGQIEYVKMNSLCSKFETFDLYEAQTIFKVQNVNRILFLISTDAIPQENLFDSYHTYFSTGSDVNLYYILKNNEYILGDAILSNKSLEIQIRDYYNRVLKQQEKTSYDLLNKFEWLAMHFNTGIAEDDVVFQSLHQLFLKTVAQLYFRIVAHNVGDKIDKYYTNIIELYVSWNNKLKLQEKRVEELELARVSQERKLFRKEKNL